MCVAIVERHYPVSVEYVFTTHLTANSINKFETIFSSLLYMSLFYFILSKFLIICFIILRYISTLDKSIYCLVY